MLQIVEKEIFFERLNFVQIARSLASFVEKFTFFSKNINLASKLLKKLSFFEHLNFVQIARSLASFVKKLTFFKQKK